MNYPIIATVNIKAPRKKVWNYMIDLHHWWVNSNPEHISLEILSDDQKIQEGTQIRIKERVAGIPGEAIGEIQDLKENETVTWRSDKAVYRYLGFELKVQEGVQWTLNDIDEGTQLSAKVWAKFPATFYGRLIELIFRFVLNGVKKDYDHAMREVLYIKKIMES